jgi:cytoskeletal protein CcmA (bactofilin family)
VDAGTLQMPLPATNTGTYTLGALAALNPYNGGTFNVTQFTGTGTLSLGGTTVLNGDWTTFTGTTLLGSGTTTFNGNVNFPVSTAIAGNVTFNGSVNLTGTTGITGTATFNGTTTLGTVNLSGTLTGTGGVTMQQLNWTGGTIGGTGSLTIASGPIAITSLVGLSQRMLTNPGTMTISGSGQIAFTSGAKLINPAGSTIDIQDNNPNGNGIFYYNGGAVSTLTNAGLLKKSAGTGTSTMGTLTFTNTGSVEVDAGTLVVPTYSETASSNLTFLIGGTTPGTQFGRLVVSGAASFAGTFNVVLANGYVPNIGDQFALVQYTTETGTPSAETGFNIGNGEQFSPTINPTNITLTVVVSQ